MFEPRFGVPVGYNSKVNCVIDATRNYVRDKICTKTGVLERTRSHEVEDYLNFNGRSSLILDYLVLALVTVVHHETTIELIMTNERIEIDIESE